jgi:PHD/YefM family antitoxin component YafN of YafNO toxin-antitoxin module
VAHGAISCEDTTMKMVGNTQFASISEAKSILPKLVEEQLPTVLLRHNQPVAAIVSIERYNAHLALEALVRHPELFDRLRDKAKIARATPLAMLRTMKDLERLYSKQRDSQQAAETSDSAAPR